MLFAQSNYNIVGGTEPGAGNVISSNHAAGVELSSNTDTLPPHHNTVQGNFIGTNPDGTLDLGNGRPEITTEPTAGVVIFQAGHSNLIGGTASGADNVIAFNTALAAYDTDGDAITFILVSNPAHGTINNFDSSTGAYSYTPEANYNGTDQFTYKVSDGDDGSNVATVAIDINPVNDAPVATSRAWPRTKTAPGTAPSPGRTSRDQP